MTGPEHYLAAEEAIEFARDADLGSDDEAFSLALAQIHATMALAAATAAGVTGVLNKSIMGWNDVLAAGRGETP